MRTDLIYFFILLANQKPTVNENASIMKIIGGDVYPAYTEAAISAMANNRAT